MLRMLSVLSRSVSGSSESNWFFSVCESRSNALAVTMSCA